MTDIDIDAIRTLTDAATPGPWQHDGNDGLVWPQRIGDPVSGSNEMTDADFIAAARTHVPALCDEVAQLRAALTQSRAQAATHANQIGALVAENARLRQQRDAHTDVVEAAKAWRYSGETAGDHRRAIAALSDAVDALPKTAATR